MNHPLAQLAVCLFPCFGLTLNAAAAETPFTYQGNLRAGTGPVTGVYDLRFAVYDAATDGNVVAAVLTNSAICVTNGLFVTQLDFGSGVFDGSPRWLAVAVRVNGESAFNSLAPRQLITSVPYALYAWKAETSKIADSVASTNILGLLPLTALPASVITNAQSDVNIAGNFRGAFTGDAAGLTNLTGYVANSYSGIITALGFIPATNGATIGPGGAPGGDYGLRNIAYTRQLTVDFSDTSNPFKNVALSGDVALAVTNQADGKVRMTVLRIATGNTNRQVVLGANWNYIGCFQTNVVLSNSIAYIHLASFGTNASEVDARLEAQ